jgi:hypothetical protein
MPAGDGLGHAAHLLDLLDQLPGLLGQIGGQLLDVVGARQRIDDLGHAGLLLQDQLRVARDPGGESVGSAIASSKRVGVQRLRAAQHRAHRLEGGADDVVVGVLLLQAHAGGLAMGAQHLGALGFFGPNSS